MRAKEKDYGKHIVAAAILAVISYMITSSIETILHTELSLHRYLMIGTTLLVWSMTIGASILLVRASNVDVMYTKRKIIPLVVSIFPIYVFVFQGALLWMWIF